MLPNIHHENWIEAGDIARLVQRDPMIRKAAVSRIFITDGPANTAHFPNANEVGFPNVVTAESCFSGFKEMGSVRRVAGSTSALQVVEIILVQDHAVVFKSKPARQFGVG